MHQRAHAERMDTGAAKVFAFSLDRTTNVRPFSWAGDRWESGQTWIRPFHHPALEQIACTDGKSSLLAVRERASGRGSERADARANPQLVPSGTYDEMKKSILNWPLEYCVIERAPDGSFQISSGQWGTAPVYVAESAGRLHGSWSFVDLTPHASLDDLNDVEVVRLLTYRKRYSRETLLGRIFQITERSRATYDATGLRFTYPAPATQVQPREIRDGIDVLDVYEQELEHAISQRSYDAGESAVELSGGMDSANVAMSLAALHHGEVLACALMFGGATGVQQARRRTEMLKLTGFRDLRVDALSRAPFHPAGERMNGALLDPFTEPYHEAVGMIIAEVRRNGTTTVFTGDGGDELVSLRGDEWAALGKVPGRHNTHREPPRWLTSRARELL